MKKSYRCKEVVAKGLPGIVLKPQLNPLAGDSSMRTNTSWWKKADLAILYIPSLHILQMPRKDLMEIQLLVTIKKCNLR